MFNRRNHEKDLLKSVIGASLSLNRNLYGEKPNVEFKKPRGRDLTKRRILAGNGPEYAGRGTKKISPRRISGADILSVTLELRRI